ncbi:hypothetical protein NGB78_12870 [Staphylococcus arlettae]|uniref:hypothetical protein n=1 Tax=Staphylococcus TaxID=1279 RepID=UPI002DBA778E|nr:MULTISPECIES: hypothetical protein [Staphylococcus]MEB6244018.1 hypothetical protein [Staphylococcus gallinarum]MEB6297190.1 hypothetical protein [Staphylococcus gallinarum]MEB7422962.1 hypothetical protein [Staphylococcus arlettae]
MKYLKSIIPYILAILPIEYIALSTDYYTGQIWGYILFTIISIGIGIYIYIFKFKKIIYILLVKVLGMLLSWLSTNLFINIYNSGGYFKPLNASSFSILLSIVSLIILSLTSLLIYSSSSKRD